MKLVILWLPCAAIFLELVERARDRLRLEPQPESGARFRKELIPGYGIGSLGWPETTRRGDLAVSQEQPGSPAQKDDPRCHRHGDAAQEQQAHGPASRLVLVSLGIVHHIVP